MEMTTNEGATPLVSIITNTLNRAALIHRCIESIQKQTYQNYEHIIVDGASDDNTEEVVKSYNDPHIKYIKLDKRGPQIQMRAGMNIAQGKYITFLDDDDEYLPEKLEKQVALFETEPDDVGVVYCWMSYYNNDDPTTCIRIHKTELRGFVGDIVVKKPLVSGTPTLMLRKEVFESEGGTFDDSIGVIMSDWELMARICQHTKVDYVPESLVKVYVNHGYTRLSTNLLTIKAEKFIKFHTHFLTRFRDIFERHPDYAENHLYALVQYNSVLKNRKEAIKYYKQYLKIKTPLKNKVMALYHIIFGR